MLSAENVSSSISLLNGETETGYLDLADSSSQWETMSLPLQNLFEGDAKFLSLLQGTCNYWPNEESSTYQLWRFLYIFGKVAILVASCCLVIIVVVFSTSNVNYYDMLYTILICITKFIGFVSVLPAHHYNQLRLRENMTPMGPSHDKRILGAVIGVCKRFGISVGITVLIALCLVVSVSYFNTINILAVVVCVLELVTAMYLTFNLVFLLLDVEVSKLLIEQMSEQADAYTLTLCQFNTARNEIHRRVDLSKWATDIIIAPCLASTVTIVATIFYLDNKVANTIIAFAYMVSLLKELMFMAVAFYYVAQVNEKADALTVKLSKSEWYPDAESLHKADAQRISICASSIVEPISFTLLFKRLSWRNLALSAFGFALSVFIAILKNLITSF